MKIELLLNNVNQDQISNNGPINAFYGWMHGPASGSGSGNDIQKLPTYSLRKETWGGVFIYGLNQCVYIVDHEAYIFLDRLKSGEAMSTIKANPMTFSEKDIDYIESFFNTITL